MPPRKKTKIAETETETETVPAINPEKQRIFDTEFPAYNEQLVSVNNEIIYLKAQVAQLEQQKLTLQYEFRNKCIHRFGTDCKWSYYRQFYTVTCEICGYEKTTYLND